MTDQHPNTIEIQHRDTLLPAYFGDFGGQYVPEPLFPVLDELEKAFVEAREDQAFLDELARLQSKFLGRPTPTYECENLPRVGSSRIFLKREDLAHGGAHKGNQVLAQALLAKRLGKNRLIAETGAGQHGTATAMVAALMDMECVIYMGAQDVARQQPNVRRMRLMGATVVPVTNEAGGSMSNAIDIALNDWVENLSTTHYVLGSACGPHPFPTLVKEFQAVISRESRQQMLEDTGRLPDAVIAAVGGGSNAIGAFAEYLKDEPGNADVKLIGVEPAGEGLDTDKHGAALNHGKIGLLHGSRSYVVTGQDGEVLPESFSVSAGLDYPGVGPEHSYLREIGRAEYVAVTDEDALQAFRLLSRYEASSRRWNPPTLWPTPEACRGCGDRGPGAQPAGQPVWPRRQGFGVRAQHSWRFAFRRPRASPRRRHPHQRGAGLHDHHLQRARGRPHSRAQVDRFTTMGCPLAALLNKEGS